MKKIFVSFPPGGGYGAITQAMEILIGSQDDIAVGNNGSTHREDNPHMRLKKAKHVFSWDYTPGAPIKWCSWLKESLPLPESVPDDILITGNHYETSELEAKKDRFDDWIVLHICNATLEDALRTWTFNALKMRIPAGWPLPDTKEKQMSQIREQYNVFRKMSHVPENFISVGHYDFFQNPSKFLRPIFSGVPEERFELVEREIKNYWNHQPSIDSIIDLDVFKRYMNER